MPAVEGLVARFDLPVSVDTWRASVAAEAFRAGAVLGNDISGFADPKLPGCGGGRRGQRGGHPHPPGSAGPRPRARIRRPGRRGVCASSPNVPAGPWPPVSRPRVCVVDAGLDLGKTASQSLELLRASATLAAPRATRSAVRFQQDLPGRHPRPGDRPAPGGAPPRPMPSASPWVPGGAGPRRPWDLPGAGHAGRHPGGRVSAAGPGRAPPPLRRLLAPPGRRRARRCPPGSSPGTTPRWSAEAVGDLVAELVERR